LSRLTIVASFRARGRADSRSEADAALAEPYVSKTMDRSEVERRRSAALADIAQLVGSEDVQIRVIEAASLLVIATVADKAVRPGALQIIQRYFPGAAVKFEP
jgi:hypothetical protein